jgi:methionyl-tRNA formyltransferase
MRIVFFGTPDFAIPSLKLLHESKHEIAAIVTAPDKPRGRGRSFSVTPIKQYGLDNNIQVLTPEKLKNEGFEKSLKLINPDLFIIVAFRILPENIFTIPSKGSFNLHGSLLPKYRGAAPIQWAIINGETETGLTTFFLEKKVDTGNIILRQKISIENTDNFGTLHDKMSFAGAQLVLQTVQLIEENNLKLTIQQDTEATPAPKITKEMCEINWDGNAKNIHNLVRGLSPHPGAFWVFNNKILKIFSTEITSITSLKPFEIWQTKNELLIGTSTEAIKILELQPEGRKRMKTADFLRGHSLV